MNYADGRNKTQLIMIPNYKIMQNKREEKEDNHKEEEEILTRK